MIRSSIAIAWMGVILVGWLGTGQTQGPPAKKEVVNDERSAAISQLILENVKRYVDAFNRKDIKGVLDLFDENCVVTEANGDEFRGRKELEEEMKEAFASDPKAKISVAVDSLDVVDLETAIETGRLSSFPDGKTLTAEVAYQVVHIKKGDRWLMSHARSFNRKVLSPYDRLRELEWLVGEWVDEGNDSLIETSYHWNSNKSFLLQEFTVRVKGQHVLSGYQRIGLDPLTKQLRGWVFDTEGGYADSQWASVDGSWVVKIKGVRADGVTVTATNEIEQLGKDRLRFESVDRIVGEERMPGFQTFVVRKPPTPTK